MSREAMRRALDALIPLANAASPNERECLTDEDHERAAEALEALCAALAEPENQSQSQIDTKVNPAEPEQEPVPWEQFYPDIGKPQTTHWEGCEAVHPECRKQEQKPVGWQWLDTANYRKKLPVNAIPEHWRPLYTTPTPQPDTDCHAQGICQRSGYSIASPQRKPDLEALNAELVEALKHAAECVQTNYLPDKCGHDWDDVIAKAEASK